MPLAHMSLSVNAAAPVVTVTPGGNVELVP
jgi:hypothetical protein